MKGKSAVSKLYRDMMSTAKKFKDENFRDYFTRIVKDDFKKQANKEDPLFLEKQTSNLNTLKRQTTIENFYFRDAFDIKR